MGELNKVISINNLSYSYGSNQVLDDATATIYESKFTIILGRNGSGKSTLLRIIAGLLPCDRGCVTILNSDLQSLKLTERARTFGFLGQKHTAVFPFTVEQVVITGRAAYVNFTPRKIDADIAQRSMERVGILNLRNRIYTELSGGEQQLVMIARVLAQEPKILLLDEPTTHLDFCNQINILSLLKELTQAKLTVVAVLHDPNIAFLYGDDFIFVKEKKLLRASATENPWNAEFLQGVYGHKLQSIPYNERALIVPFINNNMS